MNLTACDRALNCLRNPDPETKRAGAVALWSDWRCGNIDLGQPGKDSRTVDNPGRPERPHLVPAREVGSHSIHTHIGHGALIHALTHIEFNAINLALDAVHRFPGLPLDYYGNWLQVAAEEATHFGLLRNHLHSLGYDYGDFPAHDGLWQMCRRTAHDPLARMALVPRLLEARGLDANPAVQSKLLAIGDRRGAEILDIILRDEIGHVRIGNVWFDYLCKCRGLDPPVAFENLLTEYDAPRPRAPLHMDARREAGFSDVELRNLERGGAREGVP